MITLGTLFFKKRSLTLFKAENGKTITSKKLMSKSENLGLQSVEKCLVDVAHIYCFELCTAGLEDDLTRVSFLRHVITQLLITDIKPPDI